ncbi:MAG: Zn-dependent oligopeptidase [Elusimicrobiota bacterium]
MNPVFNYSKEYLKEVVDKSIAKFEEKIKMIVGLKESERNFKNTVVAFENALADFSQEVNIPVFLAYVSPDPEIRNIAQEVELKISQYSVEIFTREDIFNAIYSYSKNIKETLNETDRRLLDKFLFEFKQNGLFGDEKTRKKIKKLLKKLVEIEIEFQKNLRETRDFIEVDENELKGLGENFISRLKKSESGKYIITTDYPEYIPFMENAEDDDARKRLEIVFNNRCYPKNVELMEEAIKLRQKIAKALGYPSFADYILEDRMAKNSSNVFDFLNKVYAEVKKKGKKDLRMLCKIRKQKTGVDNKIIYNWQWRYYSNILKKEKYQIDHEKVSEYFPLERVITGMFNIFEKVFSVKFEPKEMDKWHKDVRTYEVKDLGGNIIAYFYFDLFPRDGKYKHAACFSLVKGRELDDGKYLTPASAIVANFTPPSSDRPSLLKFSEVVTLFHEFGHVTHNIFTRSKYAKFSGTSVSRDFVEVPSQMLENWGYYGEVIKAISSHYRTNEPLDDSTIQKIIRSKNATSGIFYLRQLFFAFLDMIYHTRKGKVDTTKIYEKLMKKIFLIPMTEGTHPQASFGHLMGGYESGYYSYLWSEVISCDFFEEFKKNGIFNAETGKRYIDFVLSKGGSIDEEKLVKNFLGRDISFEPFLTHIGVREESRIKNNI